MRTLIYLLTDTEMVRKYVKDIDSINNKIHIGYCKLTHDDGLEFNVLSEFKDVDDLIGANKASAHYSVLLRKDMYYVYRGDRCVDGIFVHDRIYMPGYRNVKIDSNHVEELGIYDAILSNCADKFKRLHSVGEMYMCDKELAFIEVEGKPPKTSNGYLSMIVKYVLNFFNETKTIDGCSIGV